MRSGLEPEAEQEDETKMDENHGATAEVIFTLSRLDRGYNSFDSNYRNINQLG